MFTYMGKEIDTLTRDELLELSNTLLERKKMFSDRVENEQSQEIKRLREENKKLWEALGVKCAQ